MIAAQENGTVLPDLGVAKMLKTRVRYFTDGAMIGSKGFVNEVFAGARARFTEKRKDGARRMRGNGTGGKGVLWSIRDLRVRVLGGIMGRVSHTISDQDSLLERGCVLGIPLA